MSLLAVIPARANSKGLPGKALRTVGGIPMILRTLRTVEESGVADRIVVSTDGPEIAAFCRLRGYEVIDRPAELAEDDVPVIEPVRHAVGQLGWTDDVAIFQPTCPLLTPKTVQGCYKEWQRLNYDWGITTTADSHIHWYDGKPFGDRRNRQYETLLLRESGAVQFMCSSFLTSEGNGKRGNIAISGREALDIDTPDDLLLAEKLSRTAKIGFVVAAGERVGSGHYHRSKALAAALSHHEVSWNWRGDPPDWAEIDLPAIPDHPDVIIFDCLSVVPGEIYQAWMSGARTVVLEDEGALQHAAPVDLLVNDMLDPADLRYAILRSEFRCLPERDQREDSDEVLVTFGGTDPSKLEDRVGRLIAHLTNPDDLDPDEPMSKRMRSAGLVVTGQGRTVLEAAACGTPCISIAANEREARHIRLPGVTYLGLHTAVTDDQIRHAVRSTLDDRELRVENAAAASKMIDGRGLDRLVHRIEGLLL